MFQKELQKEKYILKFLNDLICMINFINVRGIYCLFFCKLIGQIIISLMLNSKAKKRKCYLF